MSQEEIPSQKSSRRGKWMRVGIALVLLFVLAIAIGPTLIAKTALRDRLINSAISDPSIRVSTQSASFGYLSPLSVDGFELNRDDSSIQITMRSMECEKSWLSMLLSKGNLGTFYFEEPSVHLVTGIASDPSNAEQIDNESQTSSQSTKSLPTLVAEVVDAGVQVRNVSMESPTIDLSGIDFTIRTEQAPECSMVKLDPVTLLDQETLTPELCSQGLQLIAPLLADAVRVEGQVSFRIDQFAVPIGDLDTAERQKLTDIGGAINLSNVSVALNSRMTDRLISILRRFGRLEDDLELTVSRSSDVQFHVTDGRVHHQGLMFLLPISNNDFQINSSGSVGFDETLDVELSLGLPQKLIGDSMVARFLTQDPLIIELTGSVNEPKLQLSTDGGWAGRLQKAMQTVSDDVALDPESESVAESTLDSEGQPDAPNADTVQSVLDIVGGLLNRPDSEESQRGPSLRERMQERREARDSQPETEPRPRLLRRRRSAE